jgi:hypothetical protein
MDTDRISGARRYPRKEYSARTVIFHDKQTEVSETIQVSEGGMMIYSRLPLEVGQILTVHFVLNETYIRARAQVVYTIPDEDNQDEPKAKVGLCFQSLFQEYREALRDFATVSSN